MAFLAGLLLAGAASGQIVSEELEDPAKTPPPSFNTLEEEARKAYASGDLPLAAGLYRNLIERAAPEADRPRLRQTLSYLLFELGQFDEARRELETALFERPELPIRSDLFPEAFLALRQEALEAAKRQRRLRVAELLGGAVRAIETGRFEEALPAIEEALRLAPDQPDLFYNRALAEQGLGQPDRARRSLLRVLELPDVAVPLRVRSLNNLAVLAYSNNELDSAESWLREAVALDERDAKAWFNLGLVLEKRERLDQALSAYRRARALQPQDSAVLLRLGSVHLSRREWVEAVGVLVEATAISPEVPEIWYQLGRAQFGLGNRQGAVQSLTRARELDPGGRGGILVRALLSLAEIHLAAAESGPALEAASAAVQWEPESPDCWNYLGLARLKSGDPVAAELAFDRATQLAPDRPELWGNLGSSRLAVRNYEAAESAFRKVLSLNPNDPEAARLVRELEGRRQATQSSAATRPQATPPPPSLGATFSRAEYPQFGLKGWRVESVAAGSAAARAGLRPGDLLLRVNGDPPPSPQELEQRWRKRRAGVKLSILREGRPLEVELPAP